MRIRFYSGHVGVSVTLPAGSAAAASELVAALLQQQLVEKGTAICHPDSSSCTDVDVGDGISQGVLEHLGTYITHFFSPSCDGQPGDVLPKPCQLPMPLPSSAGDVQRLLSAWEIGYLESLLVEGDPWQHDNLVALLNLAVRLRVSSLRDLLSAWCAVQIQRLCNGHSSLEGASLIREFFDVPNEWSDAELAHLDREMALYESPS